MTTPPTQVWYKDLKPLWRRDNHIRADRLERLVGHPLPQTLVLHALLGDGSKYQRIVASRKTLEETDWKGSVKNSYDAYLILTTSRPIPTTTSPQRVAARYLQASLTDTEWWAFRDRCARGFLTALGAVLAKTMAQAGYQATKRNFGFHRPDLSYASFGFEREPEEDPRVVPFTKTPPGEPHVLPIQVGILCQFRFTTVPPTLRVVTAGRDTEDNTAWPEEVFPITSNLTPKEAVRLIALSNTGRWLGVRAP